MALRNRCFNCGKLVPREHGYKSSHLYCDRECWKAKPPKVAALEKEFDESFADIARGFAGMGYSKAATASEIGFNLSYFRALLTRHDLHGCFLPQSLQRDECRGKGVSRGLGIRRPGNGGVKKYSDRFLLQRVAAASSIRDFRTRFKIGPGTVSNRFGSWRRARKLALAAG